MKALNYARGCGGGILGIIALGVLTGCLVSEVAFAQPTGPASGPPPSTATAATKPVEIARTQEAWRQAMAKLPRPQKGCSTSAFPSVEWKEVPCVAPPNLPYPPASGRLPFTVGNSNDFAAEVTAPMSSAEGSFDAVTGVTSESGLSGGTGSPVADTYSLQLNTKPFNTPLCSLGAPGCQGWQQFLYSSTTGTIFIQYWLLNYNKPCPSGWNTFIPPKTPANTFCWQNSPGSAPMGQQAITNLLNLRLSGEALPTGDTVIMWAGPNGASYPNTNVLNLAAAWTGVEFLVVGDCCSSQANFNAGSTIVVRTTVNNGTLGSPTCVLEGFTGETNNLNLVGNASVAV